MRNYSIRHFEALIVGAGGAGMRAALQLSEAGLKTAVLSKVFPTRSHTVAAQGGVSASLGNSEPDNWHWHMYDTVKGSDWLGDQDTIEFMCRAAPDVVVELEHYGMPFDRNENGTIYQRPFGGHMSNFGEKPVRRACATADRTGHAMLHALYQRNVRANTHFFVEWLALDIVRSSDGQVQGVLAMEMETGELVIFQAKATLFATGGAGRVFASSTNAHINTGDGVAMVARADIPLEDMEFWQFHPTGVAGAGVLITEGVRGEGGILRNDSGERFMERYAPNAKDLASRDVVSRAMLTEINEGRGCGSMKDHVLLDITHLDPNIIFDKLPGIREISIRFAGVDPVKAPIPVVPTCHYQMGGIPTNYHGQVVVHNEPVPGFYAAGECACASVHGANRLGTNSLLDLLVFGKSGGSSMIKFIGGEPESFPELNSNDLERSLDRINRIQDRSDGYEVSDVRRELQQIMQTHCGVFRFKDKLEEGVEIIMEIERKVQETFIKDKSKIWNTARSEALELENLIEVAKSTIVSANARLESRGAHVRDDYQDSPEHADGRNDVDWLKHTLWYREGNRLEYKPVTLKPLTVETIPPKKRAY